MDIREFFYWVASISLILVSLLVIGLFAFMYYLKRLADRTAGRVLARFENMSEQVSSASRAWKNLTLTRFIVRILRYIF